MTRKLNFKIINANLKQWRKQDAMTKAQQLALIDEAFYALPDMQDGFRDVSSLLLHMSSESERDHRRGHGPYHCTVKQAAQYFVVKQLLDGWRKPNHYTVDDIMSVRNEILYAQAYAKRFLRDLTPWVNKYYERIDKLDYLVIIR